MSARNPHEDDQPDAMDQGVHILIGEPDWLYRFECVCGASVWGEQWAAHCEDEGESL